MIVPRWQYEAFRRWFVPSTEAQEARSIKADAERHAGERRLASDEERC